MKRGVGSTALPFKLFSYYYKKGFHLASVSTTAGLLVTGTGAVQSRKLRAFLDYAGLEFFRRAVTVEVATREFRSDPHAADCTQRCSRVKNCTREGHLCRPDRRPAAAPAKCSREAAARVEGARLGALSSHTGARGPGNAPAGETAKSWASAGPGLSQIKPRASPVTMYWESPEKAQSHIQPRDVSPGLLLLMLSSVIREKFEVLQILHV